MSAAETHKDPDRITNPVRLARVLVGAVGAVIAMGLAAPAGASPVIPPPQAVPDFLAAARAAGITGTDTAMLEDGYSVCRRLWVRHMPGTQIAAGLVQDHPQLTVGPSGAVRAGRIPWPVPGVRRLV